MVGTILGAASEIDIKLGQSPLTKNPQAAAELQGVYNALHILNGYMGALRAELESADGQLPDVSLRFRNRFEAIAGQPIVTGNVVSIFNSTVVKGVGTSAPLATVSDSNVTIGSTGSRELFQSKFRMAYIALTDAAIGEPVTLGVGPGVIALPAAKCGQIVWAVAAQSIKTSRQANTVPQHYQGRDLVANGSLQLANIVVRKPEGGGGFLNWEGYWMPGSPSQDGGTFRYNRTFLYPVGICITDGYVLITDYVRNDSLPLYSPP